MAPRTGIRGWIDRLRTPPEASTPTTNTETPKGLQSAGEISDMVSFAYGFDGILGVQHARRLRYLDYDEMDMGDIGDVLDFLCDEVLIPDDPDKPSIIVTSPNAKYRTVINDVLKSTALPDKLWDYARIVLKYGDAPISITFDESFNVFGTQAFAPHTMKRNTDSHGRLLDGDEEMRIGKVVRKVPRAYRQYTSAGAVIDGWYSHEMLWLMWRKSDLSTYSKGSFLETVRRDWKRVRVVEGSIVIARVMRAYLKFIYLLDVTGKSQEESNKAVRDFREQISTTRTLANNKVKDYPVSESDIVLGTGHRVGPDGKLYEKMTDVRVVDPNNQGLAHLNDVEYFRNKLFRRVPQEAFGISPSSGDLTGQDLAAFRMANRLAKILESQLIRPLINLALMLKGFVPDDDSYTVSFPALSLKASWRYSDAQYRQELAYDVSVKNGTASRKSVGVDRENLTDEEWRTRLKEIQAEMELEAQGLIPAINRQTPAGGDGNAISKSRAGSNGASPDKVTAGAKAA